MTWITPLLASIFGRLDTQMNYSDFPDVSAIEPQDAGPAVIGTFGNGSDPAKEPGSQAK